MKYCYPAILTVDEENILVSVPDLPGLHTYGKNPADALFMARDAMEMWLWDAENKGESIPNASDQAEILKMCESPCQTVSIITADTEDFRRHINSYVTKTREPVPAFTG